MRKISKPVSRTCALFFTCASLILLPLTGCSLTNTRNVTPYPREIIPAAAEIETPDSATAMLRFSSNRTGLKGRAALTIKAPDQIRIEVYGAMGQILTVLAGDSNECKVYKKGVVTRCNWSEPELSGLITPKNLVPVLLGKGELAFQDSVQRRSSLDSYGRLTLVEATPAFASQVADNIKITIGDYRTVQGLRVPFRFVIEGRGEVLTLEYYSLIPNPQLEQTLFSLGSAVN